MTKKHSLLMTVALGAGLFGKMMTSTREIAHKLNLSQQSVSRLLKEMENEKILSRVASPTGVVITLEKKGIAMLEKDYNALKRLFEKKLLLEGRVVDGFGEGKYYVRQYNHLFKEKLGFKAYPGTLNLIVNSVKAKEFINGLPKVRISAFKSAERSFGSVEAAPIRIGDSINGALLLPERTRHSPDTIEIIAPVCIKDALKVKAGNKVKLA